MKRLLYLAVLLNIIVVLAACSTVTSKIDCEQYPTHVDCFDLVDPDSTDPDPTDPDPTDPDPTDPDPTDPDPTDPIDQDPVDKETVLEAITDFRNTINGLLGNVDLVSNSTKRLSNTGKELYTKDDILPYSYTEIIDLEWLYMSMMILDFAEVITNSEYVIGEEKRAYDLMDAETLYSSWGWPLMEDSIFVLDFENEVLKLRSIVNENDVQTFYFSYNDSGKMTIFRLDESFYGDEPRLYIEDFVEDLGLSMWGSEGYYSIYVTYPVEHYNGVLIYFLDSTNNPYLHSATYTISDTNIFVEPNYDSENSLSVVYDLKNMTHFDQFDEDGTLYLAGEIVESPFDIIITSGIERGKFSLRIRRTLEDITDSLSIEEWGFITDVTLETILNDMDTVESAISSETGELGNYGLRYDYTKDFEEILESLKPILYFRHGVPYISDVDQNYHVSESLGLSEESSISFDEGNTWSELSQSYNLNEFVTEAGEYNILLNDIDNNIVETTITVYTNNAILSTKDSISFDTLSIDYDIELPQADDGITLTWESSNINYLDINGLVTQPGYEIGDIEVILTVTITIGEESDTKIFDFTVKGEVISIYSSVIQLYANAEIGEVVGFHGFVSGIWEHGYYLTDGIHSLAVYNPFSRLDIHLNVVLEVFGTFEYFENQPQLSNIFSDGMFIPDYQVYQPVTQALISEIAALDPMDDPTIYGRHYTITGTIIQQGLYNNLYITDGDIELLIYYYSLASSISALENYIGETVTITVFYYTKNNLGPIVAFDGLNEDIEQVTLD